jgi:hypothetical protein
MAVTVVQTVLMFVGIPLGVIIVIAIASLGRSTVQQPNRYRPGRPWEFPPAWYVPHPDAVVSEVTTSQRALEGRATSTTAVGGASGEW